MKIKVYQRFFYNADCLTKGYNQGAPKGIQVHSTGCNAPYLRRFVQPDDGRIGMNSQVTAAQPNGNSHNRENITTCASAYIGKQADGTVAIYQALPWTQRCWLSGSYNDNGKKISPNANKLGYIGYEVLEDNHASKQYFEEAMMTQAAALTAYLCMTYGISIDMVKDHRELHDMKLASNHGDIKSWAKDHGYTMNDFRERVKAYMEEGVEVEYINCEGEALFRAKCTCTGTYLNIRQSTSKDSKSIGRIPKGEELDVIAETNDTWWKCRYNGVTGYCMTQYLSAMIERVQVTLDKNVAEKLYASLSKEPLMVDDDVRDCTAAALRKVL